MTLPRRIDVPRGPDHQPGDRLRWWRIVPAVVATFTLRFMFAPVAAQQQRLPFDGGTLPAIARAQIDAVLVEKAERTPVQRKISSHLLYADRMRRGEPAVRGITFRRSPVEVAPDGRVELDIRADVTDSLRATIETLGGTVLNSVPSFRAIRASLPLDRVETVAALSEVQFIAPADRVVTRRQASRRPMDDESMTRKINTSQGDVAHGVASARSTYGIDGSGIGIGVMSNGVATLAARQASGDLPANVMVLPGQAGSGDEGTAMLEIVYDLAPGADLFFATGGSEAQIATNIQALCNAGADVIVDDSF